MAYEFDFVTALDRKGHDSSAADYEPAYLREGFDFIPMVRDYCKLVLNAVKGTFDNFSFST